MGHQYYGRTCIDGEKMMIECWEVIKIKKDHVALLMEETKRRYPVEACGLLFGKTNNKEIIIREITLEDNVYESTTRFKIDPEVFYKELLRAENRGLHLVGFFHSHKGVPYPSPTDIKYMSLWPRKIWIIVSSTDYNLHAYQAPNHKFRRIHLRSVDCLPTNAS